MTEEVASKVTNAFSASFFIALIIGGFFLLFMSPMNFLFRDWISFPTVNQSDVLGRIALIFILCLILGIPVFLTKDFFTSDFGLNHWLAINLKDPKKKENSLVETSPIKGKIKIASMPLSKEANYVKWLLSSGYSTYVSRLNALNSIVQNTLAASEIAAFFNFFILLVLSIKFLLSSFFPFEFTLPFLIKPVFFDILIMLILSFGIFVSFWIYSKFHWRDRTYARLSEIRKEFFKEDKMRHMQESSGIYSLFINEDGTAHVLFGEQTIGLKTSASLNMSAENNKKEKLVKKEVFENKEQALEFLSNKINNQLKEGIIDEKRNYAINVDVWNPKTDFCGFCKLQLAFDAIYCSKCGKKIKD